MNRLTAVLASAVALAWSVAAQAGVFLKIPEIAGDSVAKGFEKTIELQSFSFGVEMPISTSRSDGGGATVGRAKFNDLTITKSLDSASVGLFSNCASGKSLSSATLFVTRTTQGNTVTVFKCTLSNVVIHDYAVTGDESAVPQEQVKISFGRVEIEYTPIKSDGTPDKPIRGGWDTITNKAIGSSATGTDTRTGRELVLGSGADSAPDPVLPHEERAVAALASVLAEASKAASASTRPQGNWVLHGWSRAARDM